MFFVLWTVCSRILKKKMIKTEEQVDEEELARRGRRNRRRRREIPAFEEWEVIKQSYNGAHYF